MNSKLFIMKKDLMSKYLYFAHAHSGCFVDEKRFNVQIFIFFQFFSTYAHVNSGCLVNFLGETAKWAQMGLLPRPPPCPHFECIGRLQKLQNKIYCIIHSSCYWWAFNSCTAYSIHVLLVQGFINCIINILTSLVWLAWLAWHSMQRSIMWFLQIAQLSTTISHAQRATALHFLTWVLLH